MEEFIDEDFRQGEFGVRVSAGGRRAFFLRYRVNGKRRRLPLGSYPGVSLAQARSKALESVVGVEDGKALGLRLSVEPKSVRKKAA